MMMRAMIGVSVFAGLLMSGMGCSQVRDLWDRPTAKPVSPEPQPMAGPTTADHEQRLRQTVAQRISAADNTPTLIRRKPYFFKQYEIYPRGMETVEISLTEQDSLTSPFLAEVQLPKQRYATKLHRNRGDAREDTNLFRETGRETLTYELRHGDWVRIGSLFTVDQTEEQVNGEWVPAQAEVQKVVAEEPRQGVFGRTWSWITGR